VDELDENDLNDELETTLWNGLEQRIKQDKRKQKVLYISRVAALFFIIVSIAYFTTMMIKNSHKTEDLMAFLQENRTKHIGDTDKITFAFNGKNQAFAIQSNEEIALGQNAILRKNKDTIYILGNEVKNIPMYIHVPRQTILTIVMNDGTMCTLNANTALAFNADFASHDRNIGMSGCGKFDVVHDSKRPMSVITGRDTIMDIGTVFYVRQYDTDTETDIAVQKGRVAIGQTNINAGEQAHAKNGSIEKYAYDNDKIEEQYIHNTTFSFEEEKMQNVLKQLANWYGLALNDSAAICDKTFTGKLPNNLPLEAIVDILNDLSDCKITIISPTNGQKTLTINQK